MLPLACYVVPGMLAAVRCPVPLQIVEATRPKPAQSLLQPGPSAQQRTPAPTHSTTVAIQTMQQFKQCSNSNNAAIQTMQQFKDCSNSNTAALSTTLSQLNHTVATQPALHCWLWLPCFALCAELRRRHCSCLVLPLRTGQLPGLPQPGCSASGPLDDLPNSAMPPAVQVAAGSDTARSTQLCRHDTHSSSQLPTTHGPY